MKVIDAITESGDAGLNEDRVGSAGRLAWVIDGATSAERSPFLPAPTDVQWLVDSLHAQLDCLGQSGDDVPATNLIRRARSVLREELVDLGFPEDRVHPTCSVGLVVDHDDSVELLRVGDVTGIVYGQQTVIELSTTFFSKKEAAAVAARRELRLDEEETRKALLDRRQDYIMGTYDESVFSGHPDGILRERGLSVSWKGVDYILICSDGFARAVADYHLYNKWSDLVTSCVADGLDSTKRRIREFEASQVGQIDRYIDKHFKAADDIAALLAMRG